MNVIVTLTADQVGKNVITLSAAQLASVQQQTAQPAPSGGSHTQPGMAPATPPSWDGSVWNVATNTVSWQQRPIAAKGLVVAKITMPATIPQGYVGKVFNITGALTPDFNTWSFTSVPNSWPTSTSPDPELGTATGVTVDGPMFHVQMGGTPGPGVLTLQPSKSYYLNVINHSKLAQTVEVSVGALLT